MENNEAMKNVVNDLTESNKVDLVDDILKTTTKPSIGTFVKTVAARAVVSITAGAIATLGMKLVEVGVTFVGNKMSNYKEKKKLKKNLEDSNWSSSEDNVEVIEFSKKQNDN